MEVIGNHWKVIGKPKVSHREVNGKSKKSRGQSAEGMSCNIDFVFISGCSETGALLRVMGVSSAVNLINGTCFLGCRNPAHWMYVTMQNGVVPARGRNGELAKPFWQVVGISITKLPRRSYPQILSRTYKCIQTACCHHKSHRTSTLCHRLSSRDASSIA